MNTLLIIKVKILVLIKWSYRYAHYVDYYVFLVLVLGATPNHTNIGV